MHTLRSLAMLMGFAATGAHAATVVGDWTFESSVPATAGPFAAEVGNGMASAFHASTSVYSSPAGNGSSHSFSSNAWTAGDYYQFSVGILGGSGISLSWDQASSSTGPKDFALQYSTNGGTFTDVADYSVLVNGSPNTPWTSSAQNSAYTFSESLSSIASLNNQANVLFRLVDLDTTAENGGTVAGGGTDRVDNFTVSAAVAPVPLPGGLWLFGSGLAGLAAVRRRRTRTAA